MTLGEAKKLARLAVKRYGVDADRALRTLHTVARAARRGRRLDLIDELERQELITREQADALHSAAGREGAGELTPVTQITLKSPEPSTQRSGLLPAAMGPEVGGYRLLRRLGEGAMAEVHLARSPSGELVALKLLSPAVAGDPNLLQRFRREAEHGARLQHVNIVRILGSGFDAGANRHFLVMEHVDGPSSQQLLDKLGKLALGDSLRLALDLAHALEHAHGKNIIHRDVKPENVLITAAGVAKLADLGLSKELNSPSHLTKARHGFGTPYYMPYEQAVNAKAVDGRSDLFALGASLYHWLTGQVPFDGATAMEIMDRKNDGAFIPASLIDEAIPEAVDEILGRLLARLPEERYQTASELIVALERTGLAPATLSFVDKQVAFSDPSIQMRVARMQQATQKDVSVGTQARPAVKVWYVKFQDGAAKPRTLMATTQALLKAISRGQVPPTALACRSKEGAFAPLKAFSDFAGMTPPKPKPRPKPLAALAPSSPVMLEPARPRLFWPLALIGGGVLGLLAALAAYFLL